jgi:hypothetical protein
MKHGTEACKFLPGTMMIYSDPTFPEGAFLWLVIETNNVQRYVKCMDVSFGQINFTDISWFTFRAGRLFIDHNGEKITFTDGSDR